MIIAEIVRAGVDALPRGQSEAAYAVGLTRLQVVRLILLPQAFRIMLPALISQLVVIVKDTSLGFVIFGFSEFVRTANTVIQFFGGQLGIDLPLQMYIAVALVFILINYGLGKLAEYVQRRTSRGGRPPPDRRAVPRWSSSTRRRRPGGAAHRFSSATGSMPSAAGSSKPSTWA